VNTNEFHRIDTNIATNGSFEEGIDPAGTADAPVGGTALSALSRNIRGWNIGGNGVDYIGGLWSAADGKRSIDLNAALPGNISQRVNTVVGDLYEVVFALAGNTEGQPTVKTMTVQATGSNEMEYSVDTTGKTGKSMGWSDKVYEFVATSKTTTISFTSTTTQKNSDGLSPFGPTLDNVRIYRWAPKDLIVNGSFEEGVDPGGTGNIRVGGTNLTTGSSAVSQWNVGLNIDYIGTLWKAADGNRSVDLSGSGPGSVSQSVPTEVGGMYEVQFMFAGNPQGNDKPEIPKVKTMDVEVSGALKERTFEFDTTNTSDQAMGWREEKFNFSATSTTTTLTFSGKTPGAYGPTLDNVRMYRLLN
jgi:choice-of-anchor C domain-containing protein